MAILPNNLVQTNSSDCSSSYPHALLFQYFFRSETLISKAFRKTQPKLTKSRIAYGIQFICYSGPDDAGEVTCNILDDHNVNQFLQNFAFFEKTMANFFHIFIFDKKYIFSSINSTSSFDEQDVNWIRLW